MKLEDIMKLRDDEMKHYDIYTRYIEDLRDCRRAEANNAEIKKFCDYADRVISRIRTWELIGKFTLGLTFVDYAKDKYLFVDSKGVKYLLTGKLVDAINLATYDPELIPDIVKSFAVR